MFGSEKMLSSAKFCFHERWWKHNENIKEKLTFEIEDKGLYACVKEWSKVTQ